MFRSGKSRRFISVLLVLGGCMLLVTSVQANMRFYTIVQQVCKSYRVSVAMDQMDLDDSQGGATFNLTLQSRRNNFEEVMLVGYIATSQAIARTNLAVQTINVIVTIPKADNMLLMTSANIGLVEQLRDGEIKSSEFMRQLQWN